MSISFSQIAPLAGILGVLAIGGWILTTWLRIKHGYPLDGAWGQAIYPKTSDEAMERIKLLSSENAQLRAELGSIKDRLATVERIVTDDSHRLSRRSTMRRPGTEEPERAWMLKINFNGCPDRRDRDVRERDAGPVRAAKRRQAAGRRRSRILRSREEYGRQGADRRPREDRHRQGSTLERHIERLRRLGPAEKRSSDGPTDFRAADHRNGDVASVMTAATGASAAPGPSPRIPTRSGFARRFGP